MSSTGYAVPFISHWLAVIGAFQSSLSTVDLIAWRRLAVSSRNVAIYNSHDYIVRQMIIHLLLICITPQLFILNFSLQCQCTAFSNVAVRRLRRTIILSTQKYIFDLPQCNVMYLWWFTILLWGEIGCQHVNMPLAAAISQCFDLTHPPTHETHPSHQVTLNRLYYNNISSITHLPLTNRDLGKLSSLGHNSRANTPVCWISGWCLVYILSKKQPNCYRQMDSNCQHKLNQNSCLHSFMYIPRYSLREIQGACLSGGDTSSQTFSGVKDARWSLKLRHFSRIWTQSGL